MNAIMPIIEDVLIAVAIIGVLLWACGAALEYVDRQTD
jgi:hypothetical protein